MKSFHLLRDKLSFLSSNIFMYKSVCRFTDGAGQMECHFTTASYVCSLVLPRCSLTLALVLEVVLYPSNVWIWAKHNTWNRSGVQEVFRGWTRRMTLFFLLVPFIPQLLERVAYCRCCARLDIAQGSRARTPVGAAISMCVPWQTTMELSLPYERGFLLFALNKDATDLSAMYQLHCICWERLMFPVPQRWLSGKQPPCWGSDHNSLWASVWRCWVSLLRLAFLVASHFMCR